MLMMMRCLLHIVNGCPAPFPSAAVLLHLTAAAALYSNSLALIYTELHFKAERNTPRRSSSAVVERRRRLEKFTSINKKVSESNKRLISAQVSLSLALKFGWWGNLESEI
jgi:hypothetical protein